jgi:hypothetical protein
MISARLGARMLTTKNHETDHNLDGQHAKVKYTLWLA